jgi:NAD(P)-dependent dehydrogenase (short-subunit alcohol dehydrogenase family)
VAICSRSAANLDAATLRLADRGHRLLALVCDLTKTGTAARLVAQAEARAGGGRS